MKGLLKIMTIGLTTAMSLFGGKGVGIYDYSDNIPASRTHPGADSIELKDIPMFIVLGFDDNGIADFNNKGGATWIREYLLNKTNPSGTGNENTYDGTPMRASFYMTAKYGREWVYENYVAVREIWNDLYQDGHEIGNHSTIHLGYWDPEKKEFISFDGRKYTKEEWLEKEIDTCHDLLTREYDPNDLDKGIGIAESDLYGWRTPRLEWNDNVLAAIKEKGYVYDCSMESDKTNDGRSLYWPFTLNNGHPYYPEVTNHDGLWELPAYRFYIPPALQGKVEGKSIITGLDYNVWITKDYGSTNPEYTGPEFTEILKHTLDLRMEGNKAPLLVGLHSDIYSYKKDSEYPATDSARARQLAIEDFIDYAVNTYPEVRVVSAIDVINWMRNPVGLGASNTVAYNKHTSNSQFYHIHNIQGDKITFSVPAAGEYSLKVYSLRGTLLLSTQLKTTKKDKSISLWPKSEINKGNYLFVIEGNDGKAKGHFNIID